ncbi:hypothetical protein [Clostridium peptidivorans]|uniref:hypothetical protein n=1 Tax=Clostridium peptidivorans TaxID=100174 RepID=UPI001FA83D27|nr:hypothetical protein [Clostridium peptidivorans]
MYIDDFEDFYRSDESEFVNEFNSRDNFDEDDNFEEFDEFTDFEDSNDLNDFRNDDIFRGFDDSDDSDEFEEVDEINDRSFMCPARCPFFKQFYRQMPTPSSPPGPGQGNRPPSGPPPSVTPQEPVTASGGPQTFAVDPGAIRRCVFRFVYIWPRRGRSFWIWLTFVGRRSIAGWKWDGRRWFYFGMDLRDIRSFRCH